MTQASLLNDRLLRDIDVSKLLGIPVRTLRRWRQKKIGIPYHKLERSVYYIASEITQYIMRCRVLPNKLPPEILERLLSIQSAFAENLKRHEQQVARDRKTIRVD